MSTNILLVSMTIAALWAVLSRSILKATIGLAITSAIVTILIFKLDSPLAGVFELSVCTGLITAVFVSAISLTRPLTHKETIERTKYRIRRYWILPAVLAAVAVLLYFVKLPIGLSLPAKAFARLDVRDVLWNMRQLDLFGQISILLAGVFGIVILFKEASKR